MADYSMQEITNSAGNVLSGKVRLYVAGVLMPCISVSVSSSAGMPSSANFTMPTDPTLMSLGRLDRVPVHIFVKETMAGSGKYILLFEGFITSSAYVNSAIQQNITYSAISCLDVLNDAQLKFLSSIDDVFMATAAGAADKELSIAALGPNAYPTCLFRVGLGQTENARLVDYPVQFLENIYGFIASSGPSFIPPQEVMPDEQSGKKPGDNPLNNSTLAAWYHKWASEIRLMQRYGKIPYFDYPTEDLPWKADSADRATCFPMLYGLEKSVALDVLTESASEKSTTASAMEILRTIIDMLEYECIFFASPAYHKEREGSPDRLISSALKPIMNDTMPPACNVIFRPQVTNLSSVETFKGIPTRIQLNDIYGVMARMAQENVDSTLSRFGLIQYYPSSKYSGFSTNGAEPSYLRTLSSELLRSELHTGPWVHNINWPKWFDYLGDRYGKEGDAGKYAIERTMKERFCRRQLMLAKYMPRSLQASLVFNPYVTPGFPGVIFDGEDSQHNFAGHVTSVAHTINAAGMSTNISMNFVRSLDEAANVEIPSPVLEIMEVTHNKDRLTRIYQSLLGDGDPVLTGAPEEALLSPAYPGANAVSFEELNDSFASASTDSSSCQNSLEAAYAFQRRNIASFEDYCNFMRLSVTEGTGPEGGATPIDIHEGAAERTFESLSSYFTVDRHPLNSYLGITKSMMAEAMKDEAMAHGTIVGTGYYAAGGVDVESFLTEPMDTSARDALRSVAQREFSRYIYSHGSTNGNISQ